MVTMSIQELETLAKNGDAESIKYLADLYHKNGEEEKAFAFLSFFMESVASFWRFWNMNFRREGFIFLN